MKTYKTFGIAAAAWAALACVVAPSAAFADAPVGDIWYIGRASGGAHAIDSLFLERKKRTFGVDTADLCGKSVFDRASELSDLRAGAAVYVRSVCHGGGKNTRYAVRCVMTEHLCIFFGRRNSEIIAQAAMSVNIEKSGNYLIPRVVFDRFARSGRKFFGPFRNLGKFAVSNPERCLAEGSVQENPGIFYDHRCYSPSPLFLISQFYYTYPIMTKEK